MYFDPRAAETAKSTFKKVRDGAALDEKELLQFKCAVLLELSRLYHAKNWVQQFHLGALRGNNSRMLRELGPDTGFDSIGDYPQAQSMSRFFNTLDDTDQLAKTIIYNVNPSDNDIFATMLGNFSFGTPGKMQWGSGWWFMDQKDGMERQMNTLSNMGLLSRFVGMVTDSRSFLSYPRHEYFRRILCNILGNDIENGELPDNLEWIGKMVEDVCYNNAKDYFRL
jgi:glucuronate isomerase